MDVRGTDLEVPREHLPGPPAAVIIGPVRAVVGFVVDNNEYGIEPAILARYRLSEEECAGPVVDIVIAVACKPSRFDNYLAPEAVTDFYHNLL